MGKVRGRNFPGSTREHGTTLANIAQGIQTVGATYVPPWGTVFYHKTFWDELFPAEQARIVRLLVERIDLSPDDMQVRLRADGLQTLVEELRSREARAA